MSITFEETSSGVDSREFAGTGEGHDDWLKPDYIERTPRDTTCLQDASNGNETASLNVAREIPNPVRKKPLSISNTSERLKLLQQWECVISKVHDEYVECEMHDLTDERGSVEYAEVYIDEFNEYDRELLQEGGVFYWSIGHSTARTGQVRRYSDLRVRRMPPVSKLKRKEFEKRATELSDLFTKITATPAKTV